MLRRGALLLVVAALTARAGNIPVFNSGVDDTGALLPDGSIDPHYTVLETGDPADVLTYYGYDTWVQDQGAGWISWTSLSSGGVDAYFTFRTVFDLTGFDPATASLSGGWAADDFGSDILLNGVSLGIATPGGLSSYDQINPFTIPQGSGFVAGLNTLDFVVHEDGSADGVKIVLSGTADPSGAPEPAGGELAAIGVAGLVFARALAGCGRVAARR